jgi:predicted MPP superfamily phosphohydrolase
MRALWIIVPIVVLTLGIWYIGWRLIAPSNISPGMRTLAWIAVFAWEALTLAGVMFSRRESFLSPAWAWVGYISLGLLSLLFTLVAMRDLLLLVSIVGAKVASLTGDRKGGALLDTSRRAHLVHLTNLGVLGGVGLLGAYGIYQARKRPGIVDVTVPIARLPKEFDGFRIVQITDVHAGLTVSGEWIETIADEVTRLKPDLIAFTGDVADGSVTYLRDAVAPLGRLSAPHGTYFITGNHEYYSGAEEWVAHMRELGYDVLMNEHRLIERNGASIVLAGVTDYSGGGFLPGHRSDPHKAFAGAPTDTARIFLAHQPKTLRQSEGLDFDLMISGHTHGGQFFPWNFATTLDQPYLKGLHRDENRWIYVSKGTGYWGPPVRLGARSEVTVITLRTA